MNSYINPGAGLENVLPIAPISVLFCSYLLLIGDEARVRLGICNNCLVLHDQISNRAMTASGKAILYDGRRIAFGAISVKSSALNQPIYDNADFVRTVYPLLASSNVVKPHSMQIWRAKNEQVRITESMLKAGFIVTAFCLLNSSLKAVTICFPLKARSPQAN